MVGGDVERRRRLTRRQTVEQLWSRAGATSGNRTQVRCQRKRLKRADRQPVATDGNLPSFDGKEGVDGSSPSEGFCKVAPRRPVPVCVQSVRRPLRA